MVSRIFELKKSLNPSKTLKPLKVKHVGLKVASCGGVELRVETSVFQL